MMYNFGGCILFDNYEQALVWCRGGAPAERALKKRRRIAARLAEVQKRTVYQSIDFICAGCGDLREEPMFPAWECECGYSGVAAPEVVLAVLPR